MNLASAMLVGLGVCLGTLAAQECAPVAGMPANGTLTGALDAASCRLGDGTPYTAYRLDLPARGQIKLEVSAAGGQFSLTLRDGSGVLVDSGASIPRPIEAGSYTVLVGGRESGQTGSFTVTTTFTAEPGILCSNFPRIGTRQSVEGRLPSSGCLALDGTPFEAYTLSTGGGGTLKVEVAAQDFTPSIAVRSLDGRALAGPSPSPLDVVLSADSRYLVIVTSAGPGGGAYQITTNFREADNDACRARMSFTESGDDAGAIDADSCFATMTGSGEQVYYNYYDVTLLEAGLMSVSASSRDFTATLKLLDAAGNPVAFNTGGGGSGADDGAQSILRAQLPAGAYLLQIASDVPSGGNYALRYVFQAGNPQPCPATPLNFGDRLSGTLSGDDCRTSLGMMDLYTFTVPSAGTVDLEVSSGAFDAILAIRDSRDNLMVRDKAASGAGAAHVAADLPAGVYSVAAAAAAGAGPYELTAKFTAHEIPACSYVQPLDLNGGFIQRLGPRSCIGSNGQPVDYYTFSLSTDSLVLAVMTSTEVDGYLALYDAGGKMLRSDNSSYGFNDPLIIQYLPAGTYRLAARGASGTAGGLYQVDLRTTSGPRPPLCTSISNLSPGASVTGVITYTGCQYGDGTFADLYRITLPEDAALDLRLSSSEFDAYLVLLDAQGAVLDENDDTGGGTNANITRELSAGAYFLVVKPFGDYTSHGSYRLVTN